LKKEARPKLNRSISPDDFTNFYWLKAELVAFCQKENLSTQGGKIQLTKRIKNYLLTGEKSAPLPVKKASSNFDWHAATLTLQTTLTDNYKNTENVRSFFKTHIGDHFKFNVAFMNWMKSNTGLTLSQAIDNWHRINSEKKNSKKPKTIAPQFEYNRYIRDFMSDNPDLSRSEAIKHWKIKKSKRGDNVYHPDDLSLNG